MGLGVHSKIFRLLYYFYTITRSDVDLSNFMCGIVSSIFALISSFLLFGFMFGQGGSGKRGGNEGIFSHVNVQSFWNLIVKQQIGFWFSGSL